MAISNPVTIGTAYNNANLSSLALTTTAAVTAGAKILLVVGYYNAVTISSVTDGTNTYRIDKAQNVVNCRIAVVSADCPAGLSSGATITVNWSGAALARSILAAYSTGITVGATANYGAVAQDQTGTTTWSSTSTTVTSGDLLWGGCHWEDSVTATDTASGGNTELHDTGVSGSAATSVYQIGTGASIAASGTWTTTSANTSAAAVAYSAAGGAAAVIPDLTQPPMR